MRTRLECEATFVVVFGPPRSLVPPQADGCFEVLPTTQDMKLEFSLRLQKRKQDSRWFSAGLPVEF